MSDDPILPDIDGRSGSPDMGLELCLLGNLVFRRRVTADVGIVSAFPDRISVEDSTATAEVWATIKRGGQPVADSTRVVFATTVGTIEDSKETQDGLAVALLTSPGDGRPRRAQIIAQAIAIRDTLEIDFILSDQQ